MGSYKIVNNLTHKRIDALRNSPIAQGEFCRAKFEKSIMFSINVFRCMHSQADFGNGYKN